MTGRTSTEVDPELTAIMADAVEGAAHGTGALRNPVEVQAVRKITGSDTAGAS